jgi:hypothetical protein
MNTRAAAGVHDRYDVVGFGRRGRSTSGGQLAGAASTVRRITQFFMPFGRM